MDDLNTLTIEDFRGGIVEQGRRGPRGSFRFGYGLNIRDGENTLKCQQKLKKDSSTTVTDLPLVMIKGSDGNKYAFGDTGKIYRKIGTGAWALVYTDADGKITGAYEYTSTTNTFIFYATQTKLKKITLANAGGTWSGNITTVGTFTTGSADDYHTMWEATGVLFVADGQLLAIYDYNDATNFSALRLPTKEQMYTLRDRNDRVIMGTKKGILYQWDRLADSWFGKKDVQAGTINAMEWLEGGAVLQVGDNGNLKYWNLAESYPFKRIPDTSNSLPNGICIHNELVHIGMNGGSKNGVYTIGRYDKNDPIALNLEYIPSHGKLTGTTIGALLSDDDDLYVAWKDGSTYGIDIIDHSNKAPAVYESMVLNMGKPQLDKLVEIIKIETLALPENCSYTVKWRSSQVTGNEDADGWNQCDTEDGGATTWDEEDTAKSVWKCGAQGETYEIRIELTPNGNNTPEIRSINSYFDFLNSL